MPKRLIGMDTLIPHLWTPQDVGLWLTVPTEKVIRLARRGLIPCVCLPDGELLFDPTDLSAWIADKRRGIGSVKDAPAVEPLQAPDVCRIGANGR